MTINRRRQPLMGIFNERPHLLPPAGWHGPTAHGGVLAGSRDLACPSLKGRSRGRHQGAHVRAPIACLGQSKPSRTPTSSCSREF